jgi:hypothetical protein
MAAPGTAVDELLTRTKLFSRKISWNEWGLVENKKK